MIEEGVRTAFREAQAELKRLEAALAESCVPHAFNEPQTAFVRG